MIETPEFRFVEATHKYFLGNLELPSVTGILDSHGLISPFAKNERAALRGSKAHIAAKYLFQGRLDWSTVSLIILPYVVSLQRWIEASGFEAEQCEVSGYEKFLMYAGTWDVVGKCPKYGHLLADLKSGTEERWHCYQSAGYSGIAGRSLRRGAIYMQKDGSMARFKAHRDPADWGKFRAALTVFQMKGER